MHSIHAYHSPPSPNPTAFPTALPTPVNHLPSLPPQISPPSLVYAPAAASRRTLSLLLDTKPLSNSASPEEHRWEVPDEPSPQLLSREQLLRCAGGSLGGGEGLVGGSGGSGNTAAPAPAAAPAAGAALVGGADGRPGGKQEVPTASGRIIGKDVQASCCCPLRPGGVCLSMLVLASAPTRPLASCRFASAAVAHRSCTADFHLLSLPPSAGCSSALLPAAACLAVHW